MFTQKKANTQKHKQTKTKNRHNNHQQAKSATSPYNFLKNALTLKPPLPEPS
jgi:hypothetical protein